MSSVQTAGLLFIVGSAVFDFGVGIGVPRVWIGSPVVARGPVGSHLAT